MSQQLPLNLEPEPRFSLENFVIGESNRLAFMAISAFPDWPAPVMIIDGPAGCGKTHLGRAWSMLAKKLVFIDDASRLNDNDLFAAINQGLNGECDGVLLTDRKHPDLWKVALPDLRSRLNYVPKFSMMEPGDDILEEVIRKLFEDKGRTIKADIVAYIIAHHERSVASIEKLIENIERDARSQKRDVTRSFVAALLKRAGDG